MENSSLINVGELAKPATVLIEKISNAIGGIFRPSQIRRVATAEAEAEKIRAISRIDINELQQRALIRFVVEETKKQSNIESITAKALKDVNEDARPQDIEDDWISNFFDKCRLISDEQMQSLWSKILSGEANTPGKYSKRTVNLVSSIDKSDALLFASLCSFSWFFDVHLPLIYDLENEIYSRNGISFSTLKHLDEIGFLTFETLAGFRIAKLPEKIMLRYFDTSCKIKLNKEQGNEFDVGKVLLSQVGKELAPISGSGKVPGFVEYIISEWQKKNYSVSEVL